MSCVLKISLTPDFLVLNDAPPRNAGRSSWLSRIRKSSNDGSLGESPIFVVAGPGTAASTTSRLAQAMEQFQTTHDVSASTMHLHVELGLGYTHLGLMPLADETLSTVSAAACDSYSAAWARQMLHLEPDDNVIRWELLSGSRKLLISTIDRATYSALESFATEHGLRFKSCRAAIHTAIDKAKAERASRTTVWVECDSSGNRTPVVQMLRFERGELEAAWRGWIPTPTDGGSDINLDAAVHRFQTAHLAEPDAVVLSIQWPELHTRLPAIHSISHHTRRAIQ